MQDYALTKHRIFQWMGIILAFGLIAVGYWYYQSQASTLNKSPTGSLTSGLVAYWTFDASNISGTSVTDLSGNSNTGTLTSGPVAAKGKIGQGMSFDGTNDYMVVSGVDLSGTDKASVSLWLHKSSFANNDGLAFEATVNTGTFTTGFYFDPNSGGSCSGYLSLAVYGNVGGNSACYTRPATGVWHHYVAIYDKSQAANEVDLYIDGVLQAPVSRSSANNNTNSFGNDDFYVMNRSANQLPLDGIVDEMRVYSRLLSATEIQSLYALGQSDKANSSVSQSQGTGRLDSGLGGYWALDNGSGTSATDSSTNGYTGTLTSGPTWTTGQIGSAVAFDGSDDYIDTDNGSAIDNLEQLTYSAWIYPTSGNGFILGKRTNGGGTEGFRLTSSTLQGWVANFIGASSGRATSSTTVTLSTWSLVTMTYNKNGDNKPHLYINGAEVTYSEQDTLTGADNDDQYDFWIGRMQANGELSDVPYTGNIDEVRIYNRALSSDEVAQLYRLTTPTGVDTGLKGYWSFNAQDTASTTAYDRSGAGNTGTLTNGPTKTVGKLGQGIDFDGSDDYVSIADNAALDIGDTDDLTLTGWFYRDTITTDDTIIAKRNGIANTDDGYILYIDDSTDKLTFEVSENSGTDEYQLESTTTFGPGWNHFAIVWDQDSASGSEIYVNGVANNATDTGTIGNLGDLSNSVVLAIGAESDAGNPFDGKLDEVRVYKRTLSAGEIKALYDAGQADKSNSSISQPQGSGRPDSGLVNYWKFDENTGTSTTDSSTNGFSGTLTGGPTWTTGQVGSAINFDGTNDYVTATDSDDSKYLGDLTLCVWANIETTGNYRHFMGKHTGNGSTQNPFDFRTSTDNPPKMVLVRANSDSRTWNGPDTTLGQWKHYCVTSNAAIETPATFYIDGVPTTGINAGNTATGAATGSGTAIRMGYRADGAVAMDGSMDEVRIYNRILSADEIAQIYRLGVEGNSTSTETSLKGYWSFNGQDMSGTTAYDRSGAGNTGTLTGGPTKTVGKLGQGIDFDGSDDYVSIADNAALDIGDTDDLTLTGWFYRDTFTTDDTVVAKRNGIANTDDGYILYIDDSTDKLTFEVSENSGTDEYQLESTSTFTSAGWYHYAIVWDQDSASASEIYINGVADSATDTGTIGNLGDLANSVVLAIGAESDAGNPFDGKLDEVRVYKTALSAAQIAALYNQGR